MTSELPPGTATPMEEEEGPPPADATPEDMAGMDMGSPVAAEPAPTREPMPAGTEADEAAAAEIVAAMENVIACANSEDDGLDVAGVFTPNFWANEFGTDNPYDVARDMSTFRFVDYEFVGTPMTYEDGRVSVDFQYYSPDAPYQLQSERVFLAKDGDLWKVDELRFITATTDMAQTVVGLNLTEPEPGTYAIEPNAPSAPATELLTFTVINKGIELHEVVVVQLPEGTDPSGLLDGPVAFEDITFIGQVAPLFPGDFADLNLVNLPAGTYFLVCGFPGPDGAPHFANGMWVQFDVTAAG
jgi:hypothetical protein